MVMPTDVVIAISYSGETVEITSLVTSLKKKGILIIAITGDLRSTLARSSDIVLNVSVPREACPLGLAPTASTTATLAMGDALSVVLQNRKKFQEADFRKNHPGGSLGDRLKVKVEEVMLTGEEIPVVGKDGPAPRAIQILNEKNLGAVIIVNGNQQITGIVTDGDIRRAIAGGCDFNGLKAKDIMTKDPITIDNEKRAADALSIMQHHEITVLPVVDREKKMVGILHLHDLLGKGEFRFLV
jgi:arabinose-5-phosphate isomerase